MPDASVHLRSAEPADLPAILDLHRQAFTGPYEAKLVELLHVSHNASPSIVAERAGRVAGHILFSDVTLNPPRTGLRITGLAPLAVLPGEQRTGIGTRLVHAGVAACRLAGYDAIIVLGGPAYYGRFGFTAALPLGITNDYVQDGHFMILELHPGALAGVTGHIRYAPEFRTAE